MLCCVALGGGPIDPNRLPDPADGTRVIEDARAADAPAAARPLRRRSMLMDATVADAVRRALSELHGRTSEGELAAAAL
jgi:hypothetical protein